MTKPRQLKITELTQSGRSGEVPQLRINGKWLATLGFKIGETVQITTREKLLIIEPIQEQGYYEHQNIKSQVQEIKRSLSKIKL
jgi:hypothetical protein